MPPPGPTQQGIFYESPAEMRRLVLLLYALVGPVFVVVLYLERNPDRGTWEIPTITALILSGAIFLFPRRAPRPADWIVPVAIVPTVCCGIAAASCGDRGAIYTAVTTAPLAWAAILCETFVVYVAWAVATATSFAVYLHMFGPASAAAGTALFGAVNGLVAWTVHGKAQAIRTLHAESRERAARHEALVAAIPDAIARVDADGTFLDFHAPPEAPARDDVPLPAPQLVGKKYHDLAPVDVSARMRDALAKAIATGDLQTIEYTMTYTSGRRRSFESRFVRSGPREATVLRRDVTERKEAERALEESEQKYRSVVGGLAEGVVVRRSDGKLLAFNASAERIIGCTKEELENGPDPQFIHEDGSPVPPDGRPRNVCLRTGEPLRDAIMGLPRPDGSVAWLSVNAELLRHPGDDTPYAVVVTFTDVTEKRRSAQRQLRDARLAGLEQRINEIELVLTLDGRIVAANDRALEAYGYAREDLLARNLRDVRTPEAAVGAGGHLATVASRGALRFETVHVRRDGSTFPVLVSSRTFQVDGEPFVHSLIRDLTEEHRLRDQLLRSQKMESIGRLAGGVAHDFNNLLTVIRGYAAMLEADLPEEDPRREEVAEILAASTRATALTRRLLAASRRQIRHPRDVGLGEIARDAEPMLRSLLGPGVDLSLAVPPDAWHAELDRGQIEQILENLSTNARAAMPLGGSLRITISNATNPVDPEVFGVPPPPGDYVVLAVADTGKGIDAATRDRLFEPVLTTRDAVMTTGLGLAEVHGIVTQSNGHVAVTSAAGRGATFRLYFPRFRAPGAPRTVRHPPRAAAPARATILLVDDDAEVRIVTRRLLARAHYEVIEAGDGDEALTTYAEHRDEIALILTDVAMPRMTGPELVARLDASGQRRPPVIFMSAYVDSASLGMDKLPPGSAFIGKPFDKAALLAMIASALPPLPEGAAA